MPYYNIRRVTGGFNVYDMYEKVDSSVWFNTHLERVAFRRLYYTIRYQIKN